MINQLNSNTNTPYVNNSLNNHNNNNSNSVPIKQLVASTADIVFNTNKLAELDYILKKLSGIIVSLCEQSYPPLP